MAYLSFPGFTSSLEVSVTVFPRIPVLKGQKLNGNLT